MKTFKIEIPKGYEIDKVSSTFENIVFKEVEKEITERIKTFQDVLDYLGEDDREVIEYRKLVRYNITSRLLNFQKANCLVKALNERYVLDWSNHKESRYYIWWHMDVFRLGNSHFGYDYSNVPASLCFLRKEDLEEAVEKFLPEYKQSRTTL